MLHNGISPDAVTFACILKACGCVGEVAKGEQIHDEICRRGMLGKDIVLSTTLVDMYAKCGAFEKAQQVLDSMSVRDVFSWTALIAGYAQDGKKGQDALNCFKRMQDEGHPPNVVTFVCILKACGSLGAIHMGQRIHEIVRKQGLLEDNMELGNAIVDMYGKCGALSKAQEVFDNLPVRNVISWNALIAGYVQQGQVDESLKCFKRMQHEGMSPDDVTFLCIIKACGSIGAADKGQEIHDEIAKQGLLKGNMVLGNALVDMYAKCGSIARAENVLESLPVRDIVPWNALIAGYAQQGEGHDALNCVERMKCDGLTLEPITFACMLNACSHSGLVDNGQTIFAILTSEYGFKPDLEHYTCMVDLFGRAGRFENAIEITQVMPSFDYGVMWLALLGSCNKWQDVSVGRWAFDHAVEVDTCDSATYVLMANIYIGANMCEDAENVEFLRIQSKAWAQE